VGALLQVAKIGGLRHLGDLLGFFLLVDLDP